MKGVSRWAEKGGSYRSVQRFHATTFLWAALHLKFVESYLFDSTHEYILAGDATTITKAGKETFGINRFFSGLLGKVVNGLEFFVISLIDVTDRQSYPLAVKQTIREKDEKAETGKRQKKTGKKPRKSVKKKPAKLRGRPKGVLNKDKLKLELSPELLRSARVIEGSLEVITTFGGGQISGIGRTFRT